MRRKRVSFLVRYTITFEREKRMYRSKRILAHFFSTHTHTYQSRIEISRLLRAFRTVCAINMRTRWFCVCTYREVGYMLIFR